MRFAFDSTTRRKLGYRLIDHVDDYFSSLSDRSVQLPVDQRTYGVLNDVLPEIGQDPMAALDEICREMIDKGFHVTAANYFGLMNPTPTYMGFLAEALVAALNPQLATTVLAESYVFPDQGAWNAGVRTIICEIRSTAGKLTGSVRGLS